MPSSVNSPSKSCQQPIRVGLVGTGYAAKLRAETLQADPRSHIVAVSGHTPANTEEFSQSYQALGLTSWGELVDLQDVDLVIICTVNRDHSAIARAALEKGKHVVVEYPLSLDVDEAEELIALAESKDKLLHVEHIELLGGLHQALHQFLPSIGNTFYARYSTINPQRPAPRKWTYNKELFGFPLSAALSRIQRFTDLFGQVSSVSCQTQYVDSDDEFYKSCICTAGLKFTSGLVADIIYGKGENLWQPSRLFEVHGEQGALIFDGDQGKLLNENGTTPIEVGTRRGLFAKETSMVLDHLIDGTPLYITPEASVYALKVADAAHRSAQTGETILL